MYKLLRNQLFRLDAEKAHYLSMNFLKAVSNFPFVPFLIKKIFKPPSNKPVSAFGLNFKNPVGLAAGFDKNALYLKELELLGFGFVEIGTVTPKPQSGNEKPRLFRLKKDQALLNRMGFNNDGVEVITARLKHWRKKTNTTLIIGGNIGKNKITENEDAWKDYLISFQRMYDFVDYFAVNVSSPNTPGLRALQEKDALIKILTPLLEYRHLQAKYKPLLLKISPDLNNDDVNDIIDITISLPLDGLIISNTTIDKNNLKISKQEIERIGSGGISGLPLKDKSSNMIRYIHERSNGKITMIGSGGIFNSLDAKQKINAGATLIQVWTGFIYEGPSIVKNICKELI
ncbi:MAG: quinone-dependent dihydroorotate dehydrogenase [Ginsengibacter sp.]